MLVKVKRKSQRRRMKAETTIYIKPSAEVECEDIPMELFNLRAISCCPLLFTSVCSPLYPISNLNSQSMLMQLTVGRILTISDINLKFSKYAGMFHGSSA